jgi:hypothetical protein
MFFKARLNACRGAPMRPREFLDRAATIEFAEKTLVFRVVPGFACIGGRIATRTNWLCLLFDARDCHL